MSIYSGFATRKLEQEYNILLEQTVSTLSDFIIRLISRFTSSDNVHEYVGRFSKVFERLFSQLFAFENHKYLDPKFSVTLKPLAKAMNVQIRLDHNQLNQKAGKVSTRIQRQPPSSQSSPQCAASNNQNLASTKGFEKPRPMTSLQNNENLFDPTFELSLRQHQLQQKKQLQQQQQSQSLQQQQKLQPQEMQGSIELERVELKTITNRIRIDTPFHYRTFCVTARPTQNTTVIKPSQNSGKVDENKNKDSLHNQAEQISEMEDIQLCKLIEEVRERHLMHEEQLEQNCNMNGQNQLEDSKQEMNDSNAEGRDSALNNIQKKNAMMRKRYDIFSEKIDQCTEESEDGGHTSRSQELRMMLFKQKEESETRINSIHENFQFPNSNNTETIEGKSYSLPKVQRVPSHILDSIQLIASTDNMTQVVQNYQKRRSLSQAKGLLEEDCFEIQKKSLRSKNSLSDKMKGLKQFSQNFGITSTSLNSRGKEACCWKENDESNREYLRRSSQADYSTLVSKRKCSQKYHQSSLRGSASPPFGSGQMRLEELDVDMMKQIKSPPAFKPLAKILKGTKQEIFQTLQQEIKSHEKYFRIDLNDKSLLKF